MNYVKKQDVASLPMAYLTVGISDSVYRYQPDKARDDKVIAKLMKSVDRYR